MRGKNLFTSLTCKFFLWVFLGLNIFSSYGLSKDLASLNERDRKLRIKHRRIETATKNFYDSSIILAEIFTRNKGQEYKQRAFSLNREILHSVCGGIEVHYIKIGDPDFSDVVQVDLGAPFSSKYENDEQIISAVFWKPVLGKNPVGLGLFMHGGDSANKMTPTSYNPQQLAFLSLGYGFFALNFRGGNFDIHEKDLESTLAYLTKQKFIDSQKIVLTGISDGSTLNAQILGKPVAKKFAGIFLHTVYYQNPGIFNTLATFPKDLPLFLASGRLDPGATYEHTIKYIRAIKDVSSNFSYALLENGGHQLIEPVKLGTIAELEKPLLERQLVSDTPHTLVSRVQGNYNFLEMHSYSQKLIEFLDRLIHPQDYVQDKEEHIEPDLKAILEKTKVLIDIKKRFQSEDPVTHNKEHRQSSRKCHSLFHWKVILGEGFEEDNLKNTIDKFLAFYDEIKNQIFADHEMVYPPMANGDDLRKEKCVENQKLKNQIFEIIKTEMEHSDSFVLYHGCGAKAGFLYTVYSTFTRMLEISGSRQTLLRLRMNDDPFVRFVSNERLLEKFSKYSEENPSMLFNYLPWFSDVGLSTQYFLFGNYKNWYNSTFFRMFLQNESSGNIELDLVEKISFLLLHLGISEKEEAVSLAKKFEEIYQKYDQKNNGRLLQIFLSPEAVKSTCYLCERGGFPLEIFGIENQNPATMFEHDPEYLEAILSQHRESFKHQHYGDRGEFTEKRKGLKYMDWIENRWLMTPEYVDKPEHVKIVEYPKVKPSNEFIQALEKEVSEIVLQLLKNNPKLSAGQTSKTSALLRLVDEIKPERKKNRKTLSLLDLLISRKFEEASSWIKARGLSSVVEGEFFESQDIFSHLAEMGVTTAARWLGKQQNGIKDTP